MKLRLISILLTSLVLVWPLSVLAQGTGGDPTEELANLRLKSLNVQDKEAELQERLRQLDEDLKAENIERSLAGIGSTRPEELRETRRRQLQIEKDSLLTQIVHLATVRASLESAIATAETAAYHQSAKGTIAATLEQFLPQRFSVLPNWTTLLILSLLPVLGIVGLVLLIRRLTITH
jgi:chromatin segregation and condensation protein Rec8/ScpA/Scc1 (kleisin family)